MPVKYKLIIWCIIIFILSSIPNARIHEKNILDFILRKSAHITEYFVLFVLAYFTFRDSRFRGNKNISLAATAFAIIYAISDEFHQKFVPGRSMAFIDLLFDTFGVMLGNIYLWKFFQRAPSKIKKLLS